MGNVGVRAWVVNVIRRFSKVKNSKEKVYYVSLRYRKSQFYFLN